MKKLYILSLLFTLAFFTENTLLAQQNFEVEVRNFEFVPADFTIQVGDTVTWFNVSGNHNVNGENNRFPNNPQAFSNSVAGPGWRFQVVFTEAGRYEYLCDPHASFMAGAFTVEGSNFISDRSKPNFTVYPNPVKPGQSIVLDGQFAEIDNFRLINAQGQVIGKSQNNRIEVPSNLPQGLYMVQRNEDEALQIMVIE